MSKAEDLGRLREEVDAAKAANTIAQNEVSRLLKRPAARSSEGLEPLGVAHEVLHEAMERYRQFIEALNR